LQAELRTELVERGGAKALLAALIGYGLEIEFLAGDPQAAVAAGEESCRMREELGRWAELSTTAGGLALVYAELGRLDDAERWAARAEELGAPEDAVTHMLWRQARARVLARRGELEEAEWLVRGAIEIGERTEDLNSRRRRARISARFLALAGRREEAAEAVEEALARFEAKENVVRSQQMRTRLAELG
jgi:tetratricopeptide (TPR) repeat protein